MPLHHFCSSCAAKIAYDTVKPSTCPKCKKPIKDATAMLNHAIQAAPTVAEEPYEDSDMDEGLTKEIVEGSFSEPISLPAQSANSRPVKRKPITRPIRDAADHIVEGEESEEYNVALAKQLARQWAAAFDPDSIKIAPEVKGESISLASLWQAGKESREGGNK